MPQPRNCWSCNPRTVNYISRTETGCLTTEYPIVRHPVFLPIAFHGIISQHRPLRSFSLNSLPYTCRIRAAGPFSSRKTPDASRVFPMV